jgi:hypothetical protein
MKTQSSITRRCAPNLSFFRFSFFITPFVFHFMKLALNFASAPISEAIFIAAGLAEVNRDLLYCCRKLRSLWFAWKSHQIAFHWSNVSCLQCTRQIKCRNTQQLLREIQSFGASGLIEKQLRFFTFKSAKFSATSNKAVTMSHAW